LNLGEEKIALEIERDRGRIIEREETVVVVVEEEEERVGGLPWRKAAQPSLVNGNGIAGELRSCY
jgi:hypothetical protein